MSFITKLKTVLKGVGTVGQFGSFAVGTVNPPLAVLLGSIFKGVLTVESAIPGEGQGEIKKAVVQANADAKSVELGVGLASNQINYLIDGLVKLMNGIPEAK